MKYYLVYDVDDPDYAIVREDQSRTYFAGSIPELLSYRGVDSDFYPPTDIHVYFRIDPETDLLTTLRHNRNFQILAIFDQFPTLELIQSNYPELLL